MGHPTRSGLVLTIPALVVSFVVAACGKAPLKGPPEVTSENQDDPSELVFWLKGHEVFRDGGQTLSMVGTVGGKPVGFELELEPWTENGPGFVNMSTFESKARLRSQGAASDALIAFLDTHYATRLAPRRMAHAIELKAFSPWCDPGPFDHDPVRLLLMISPDFDERNDAEVMLDVDGPNHRVRWKEKEPRFRRALVQALAARE